MDLKRVVNHKKKFLDICIDWSNFIHNSRILVNSSFYNKFNNQNNLAMTFFNNKYILSNKDIQILVG